MFGYVWDKDGEHEARQKMKKILIVTTIGGFLPQFEMNDVKILMEQGYEVHYASNFTNPVYKLDTRSLEQMGIRLHPVDIQKSPLRFRSNLQALREIISIIRREGISVVHCHNPMGGVLGRLAAVAAGLPGLYVIYTAHGFHFYDGAPLLNWLLFFPVEYLLAGYTDTLITINKEDDARARRFFSGRRRSSEAAVRPDERDEWRSSEAAVRPGERGERRPSGVAVGSVVRGVTRTFSGAGRKSIYRIPGVGVKTARFAPNPHVREKVRRALRIEDGTFYILSVGELNRNKNHEVIIRAIASLNDPDICYGICGKGYRLEYLKELAREKGIERQVRFFGFRNDIPEMLQGADCFAFPSRREGLGIAALEAMAAGLPMITSDCRGTREYMEDNVTGYVCRSGRAVEYAGLIRKMKENPQKRREMSRVCQRVAEKFNLDRTDRIMREIYGKLEMAESVID